MLHDYPGKPYRPEIEPNTVKLAFMSPVASEIQYS